MAKKTKLVTLSGLSYSDLELSFNKVNFDYREEIKTHCDIFRYFFSDSHEERERIIFKFFRDNKHLIEKLPKRFRYMILAHMI